MKTMMLDLEAIKENLDYHLRAIQQNAKVYFDKFYLFYEALGIAVKYNVDFDMLKSCRSYASYKVTCKKLFFDESLTIATEDEYKKLREILEFYETNNNH